MSEAYEQQLAKLQDDGLDGHSLAETLLRLLMMDEGKHFPTGWREELETSVYRLAGLPSSGSSVVKSIIRYERQKWTAILTSRSGGPNFRWL